MTTGRRVTMWRNCLLAFTFGTLLNAGTAQACAFHGYTPNPTLVDVLLTTEQVAVVQREGGAYVSLATLAGPTLDEVPIGVGPDAATRLEGKPDATVLIARDGPYGPWVEIAVMDDRYRTMVEAVMARQADWQLGAERARLAFFAERLTDPNADIRYLALRELDRAPYGMLKQVRLPTMPDLREGIEQGDPSLLPIRVLLAGLSGDRRLAPVVTTGLRVAVDNEIPFMGAYATALIELEGAQGVDLIVASYLKSGAISPITGERLLEALALQQKTADGPLRNAISQKVAALVREEPILAGAAARQFGYSSRFRPGNAATSGTDR